MINDHVFSNHYEFWGTTLEICSNNPVWLNSLSSYLALTEGQACTQPDVKLALYEIEQRELADHIIPPLPDEVCKERDFTLLTDRPVPAASYRLGGQRWIDYSGYGRIWSDPARGAARAVRYRDCGVDPLFSDILFGFNPLVNLLWKAGFYSVHASCAAVDGKGVLFTGDSGQGKSTAALALLVNGCPILSDDRVLVSKRQGIYHSASASDVIKLRRDSMVNFFPQLQPVVPFRELMDEFYFKIGSAGNSFQFIPSVPVNRVVVLNKTSLPESRYERINPARTAGDLFPVTLNVSDPEIMKDKFSFLMDFLQDTPCYRVYFGTDMSLFARTIKELVKESE